MHSAYMQIKKKYVFWCHLLFSPTLWNDPLTFNWPVFNKLRPKCMSSQFEKGFLKAWKYQKESQKERKYNDYREREKKTNNNQLNTNDWATWAPQCTGDELMCSGSGTLHVMLNNKKYRWWTHVFRKWHPSRYVKQQKVPVMNSCVP